MYSAKSSFQHYTFGSVLRIGVYCSIKQWRQVPFKLPRSLNFLYLKTLCFRSAFPIVQQNNQIRCTSEPGTMQSFLERGLGGSELWNVKSCSGFWLLANLCLLSCAPACRPTASASQLTTHKFILCKIVPDGRIDFFPYFFFHFPFFSFSYYNSALHHWKQSYTICKKLAAKNGLIIFLHN